MKKQLLLILMFIPFISVFSQHLHEPGSDGYCSHQKQFMNVAMMGDRAVDLLLEQYDVHHYFLDIQVESNSITVAGNVTLSAHVITPVLDTFAFELIDEMTVDSVFINGELATFTHANDIGKIVLGSPLSQGDQVSAQIFYHGTPPTGGFFSGISTGTSGQWNTSVTWTLSEPYAAKDWWPTKQDLMDKADSSWVFITTSDENMAGSQGLLTAVTPMPNNKNRFEWKSKYPVDYYLISLAVANYQDYTIYAHPEGYADSVMIQNFIYNADGCLEANQAGIDQTADFIELFSELYSLYPFHEEKYGHCLAEIGGGMEHQTMTTIGNFGFGLVAHELGHMWFGDNVTCATWSDIWVNEGFATYTDYLANEFFWGPSVARSWLSSRQNHVKGQAGGSVYVPEDDLDDIGRIFSGRLSYSKGALIIHMIRYELQNDSVFYQVLQDYQAAYADSSATGLQFKEVLEETSGMDFDDFFDQWYFGEGYPIFDIVWNQSGTDLTITSTQTTSTSVTPLFKMLIPFYIKFNDGSDTTVQAYQDNNLNTFTFNIDKEVGFILFDPDLKTLHELDNLSVGLDEELSADQFSIGPNPATNVLHLYFNNEKGQDYSVSISDLHGRIVYSDESFSGNRGIDISQLSKGIYMLSVDNGRSRTIREFVKQ